MQFVIIIHWTSLFMINNKPLFYYIQVNIIATSACFAIGEVTADGFGQQCIGTVIAPGGWDGRL